MIQMTPRLVVGAFLAVLSAIAAAETQLYETGPSEDASFVRFLNGSDNKVNVTNGAAQIILGNSSASRVSKYFPVKKDAKLTATAQLGTKQLPVSVVAKPGEFITIVVLGKDASARSVLVRETPTEFNAMRASVSLSNGDDKCGVAALTSGAKQTVILEGIKPAQVKRRLVNPVKLLVQVSCDGQPAGAPLDMSQLQAGERYSVFLLPHKTGHQTFFVLDSNL